MLLLLLEGIAVEMCEFTRKFVGNSISNGQTAWYSLRSHRGVNGDIPEGESS